MSSEKEKGEKASELPKTESSEQLSKVKSANSWESVDLGDDERKKKFLKLMGASKKEHHGRFVIGNQEPANVHARAKNETEAVNSELENQYKHSYEHKITRWSHKGLGFSSEKPAEGEAADRKSTEGDNPTSSEVEGTAEKTDQSAEGKGDNSDVSKDNPTEKVERKRESTESSETNSCVPKKPKMMMNFVKSSDS